MHSRSRKAEKEPHVAPRLDCQERTTINKDLQKKKEEPKRNQIKQKDTMRTKGKAQPKAKSQEKEEDEHQKTQ